MAFTNGDGVIDFRQLGRQNHFRKRRLPAQFSSSNRASISLRQILPRFKCPCGGIGRRAALKMQFRKECPFESGQGHHSQRPARIVTKLQLFPTMDENHTVG